jgi:geranylgeranyl pyrophosphate synthase
LTSANIQRLYQQIETIWSECGAWPGFISAMRLPLTLLENSHADLNQSPLRWALLPGYCCQAAGGDPRWADPLAASWLLFYIAADLMDAVEDQDQPDPWWAGMGPGIAVNVASGLYFSASKALQKVSLTDAKDGAAEAVKDRFYSNFLQMCSGQHRDLTNPAPTLMEYWETAAAKSGTFFQLACWSGARLATDQAPVLDGCSEFGQHLGLLIQILDDLEDFQSQQASRRLVWDQGIRRSLPVVYALEVSPVAEREQFLKLLQDAPRDDEASQEAWEMLDRSGAGLYLLAEVESHRRQAMEALQSAFHDSPPRSALIKLLDEVGQARTAV